MEEGEQPDFIVELQIEEPTGHIVSFMCTEENTFIIYYKKPPYDGLGFRHIEYYWPNGIMTVIWDSSGEQEALREYGWRPILHDEPEEEILETYFVHQNSLIDKEGKDLLDG